MTKTILPTILSILLISCAPDSIPFPPGPKGDPGPSNGSIYKQGTRLKPIYNSDVFFDKTEMHFKDKDTYFDSVFQENCEVWRPLNVKNSFCLPVSFQYCSNHETVLLYKDNQCSFPLSYRKKIQLKSNQLTDQCDYDLIIDNGLVISYQCVNYHKINVSFYESQFLCDQNDPGCVASCTGPFTPTDLNVDLYQCESELNIQNDLFVGVNFFDGHTIP